MTGLAPHSPAWCGQGRLRAPNDPDRAGDKPQQQLPGAGAIRNAQRFGQRQSLCAPAHGPAQPAWRARTNVGVHGLKNSRLFPAKRAAGAGIRHAAGDLG
ncbi:hypothetical protein D8B24_20670 [Verminephrobacter aporrectodeae subsp. tuberculatae]|nr:hypothetical protein [Verminephrobacter aporrectodeae subsp. tuberculatae]